MKALRSILVVAMVAALPAAAAGQAATTGQTKKMPPGHDKNMSHHTAAAAQLRTDMRKLWTDQVVWTRDFIIAALADAPDVQAANWDEDVRAFDAVYDHILKMSDALTDGIVKQFPDKFGAMPAATSGKR